MVPPTESLRFVAGELGRDWRKVFGPQSLQSFFLKTWLNAFLQVHDLGHIGKLEANLSSFKTALSTRFSLSMENEQVDAGRDG